MTLATRVDARVDARVGASVFGVPLKPQAGTPHAVAAALAFTGVSCPSSTVCGRGSLGIK